MPAVPPARCVIAIVAQPMLTNRKWIPVASHELGNLDYHLMRAMHLAGRCVNCGECARPADGYSAQPAYVPADKPHQSYV